VLLAYDAASRSLLPCGQPTGAQWIHASDPSPEELAWIHEWMKIPESLLAHALDVDEIARVDRDGKERLVVVRVPHHPARAIAFGVVLDGGRVLTIVRQENELAQIVAGRCDLDPAQHERFLLTVVLCAAERFLTLVRAIDRDVGELEEKLQESLRNEEVHGLLLQQKALVHFMTALSSNRIMMDRLRRDAAFKFDMDLFDDVEVELHQASEMVTVSNHILSETMDAFASIISNNLNVVMKALTSLTLLATIPTVIASFYGMNVGLPGQHGAAAFAFVVVGSLAVVAVVAVALRRLRWM
jgi:magnesium transporter